MGNNSNFGPPFNTIFVPNLRYISNISQAQQAVVTFTEDTFYKIGEWISFRVPPSNGMIQLNNKQALVIALTGDTVTIDVDTLQFFPFISYSDHQFPCFAVPVGSGIPPGTGFVTLEDVFDNKPLL